MIFFRSARIWMLLAVLSIAALTRANPSPLQKNLHKITLPNGMRFLLLHRRGAPVFAANIRVKVGGIDEPDGKTGIAHLLEHMAFKGTTQIGTKDAEAEKAVLAKIEVVQKNLQAATGERRRQLQQEMQTLLVDAERFVEKEEFLRIYSKNGATNLNATTSQDFTSYFVSLPSSKLKLWAHLESSRLMNPVFREFYTEREVVKEERRTLIDDSPLGKLYEGLMSISFEKSPYRRSVLGHSQDLDALSATDLKEFYERYYVPKNIVVAIVGDINVKKTQKIVSETFGKIPAKPAPRPLKVMEPEAKEARTLIVPFDASPAMMLSFHKPTTPHPDDYAFDVLEQVLCEGNTSRLYKRLVEKDRLAQKIICNVSKPGMRLNNVFLLYVVLFPGHSAEEVMGVIQEEFRKLSLDKIPDETLEIPKKNLIASLFFEMQSNQDMADLLSCVEVLFGDWRYIFKYQKQIQSVTSADLSRLVKAYLKPEQARLAVLKPLKKNAGAEQKEGKDGDNR